MEQGLYEQLMNRMMHRQLNSLSPAEFDIGKDRLDAEEAKKYLSSYIASVTRKVYALKH
ncbi:hypothetical protein GI364_09000 [Alicyclobacillus sp. SO9]|nr:hypothetical protein GI364_09000 [Alicyclobacillus sp. SO9]